MKRFGITAGLAVAYSREDFRRLMREGKPTGDGELGLMGGVAVRRFAYLEDDEIDGSTPIS